MDGCEISGKLVSEDGAVYAVITTGNTTEEQRAVEFNYAVSTMPPGSRMSRMMPIPKQIKKGSCTVKLDRGKRTVEKILVSEARPAAKLPSAATAGIARIKVAKATLAGPVPAATWTLTISRGKVVGLGGWGAVPPPKGPKEVALDKGSVVLASTILREEEPVAAPTVANRKT